MLNPHETYDNAFQPDNVYGHTLVLLERFRNRVADEVAPDTGSDTAPDTVSDTGGGAGGARAASGVHLDLGCGFGRIAEPLTASLGLTYIGIDGAPHGIASLRARGFEAHQMLFETHDDMLARITALLRGRPVASVSMLDTLEHLTNGDMVLQVIRALIAPTNAPAVISVPNVAHRDIGFKLAMGQWDYTSEGLLDHTHVRLFSQQSLGRVLRHAGLQGIDHNHVCKVVSDQHFPRTHPALAQGSLLHDMLESLRATVDDTASVHQLVQMVVAGPRSEAQPYTTLREPALPRPFLSLITRTQGTRPHCLVEMLTCLAAQKDTDFELLVVGHKLSYPQQLLVERTLEDSPAWLRAKTRLIRVDDGNRTRPLNRGFEAAQGEYIAILDDDDLPMAHWVETFRTLAQARPGAVLRSVSARQSVENTTIHGHKGVRAISAMEPYAGTFDLLQHMVMNQSPPVGLAFPRGVFHDLNLRFDETLTTTEDWDFLLRTAAVAGVSSSADITSIYRWWTGREQSSRTDHDQAEWDRNYTTIQHKMDKVPLMLPAGLTRQLRELRALHNVSPVAEMIPEGKKQYLRDIVTILTSWSWRLSVPMRWPAMLRGRRDLRIEDCIDMPESELARRLNRLRTSSSWRATAFLRGRAK